ncbi:hypothetical protein HYC85_028029 [Camellia sinensis]|uniref:Uncharacterized protein n=1 Tax=Camellia sinensis TaxID=4442 RepID=A0A7J7FW12_CAMSI|nr:hypothetical protein HYC85_028029 [Camellia sinensis]
MKQIIANGKVPDLAEFYKSIHYNSDTHEWISSESQTQAEHLSQTSAIPLTSEELSVNVLKPRPGYVKGLGIRPSSSMNTTVAPAENSDYVQRLEMQIAQQKEQIASLKISHQGAKIMQQPQDGPRNTSNTSGGTNVSCGNLRN